MACPKSPLKRAVAVLRALRSRAVAVLRALRSRAVAVLRALRSRAVAVLRALRSRAVAVLAAIWLWQPFVALRAAFPWRLRTLYRLLLACWCVVVGHRWRVIGELGRVQRAGFRPLSTELALCARCGGSAIRTVIPSGRRWR